MQPDAVNRRHPPATTPDQVIESARSGGEWAWEQIYFDISPRLYGYLRGLGVEEVDDIVAEVFLCMVRGIERFHGDGVALRSWAYAIARNVRTDAHRARARTHEALEKATIQQGGTVAAETEPYSERVDYRRVIDLLNELTTQQQEVMLLRIVGDLTVEHIAYVLDIRVDAVKALQRRALQRLRSVLRNDDMEA